MQQNRKSFWPIGILLILLFGVILISFTIRISTEQSIAIDETFGERKLLLDENINDFMKEQNKFEEFFAIYIGLNQIPLIKKEYELQNPYFSRVPAAKEAPKDEIKLNQDKNVIYLHFKSISDNAPYLDIKSIELEFVRLDTSSKQPQKIDFVLQKDSDGNYKTPEFSLPKKGFYQARFKISADMSRENINVFYYHWLFNTHAIED